MAGTAKRTDPALWDKVKTEVTAGDKGGDPGEWSARKAQLAVQQYKKAGGGYEGVKAEDNHLSQWTREDWGTKSGKQSGETGERYLPKGAREKLTDGEYARTTAKKRRDTEAGKQFSAQPKDVAAKTASTREDADGKRTAGMSGKAAKKTVGKTSGTASKSAGGAAAERHAPAKSTGKMPATRASDSARAKPAARKAATAGGAKPATKRKAAAPARGGRGSEGSSR